MKKIALIGDSHTWGEGAAGASEQLTRFSPVEGGEYRPVSFQVGSFANIVRQQIEDKTDSFSRESLIRLSLPVTITSDAPLIRLFLACDEKNGEATVTFSNGERVKISLPAGERPKRYVCVTLSDRQGAIRIEGVGYVYRVEEYFGSWATVNCGRGSTPTFRYLDADWDVLVSPLKPDILLVEPCTINDWLSGHTPGEYYQDCMRLLTRAKEMGVVILLTCSPILSRQESPASGYLYEDYLNSALEAAQRLSIPIADAHSLFCDEMKGMKEDRVFDKLFHDVWHPNDRGHGLYAREALAKLLPLLDRNGN